MKQIFIKSFFCTNIMKVFTTYVCSEHYGSGMSIPSYGSSAKFGLLFYFHITVWGHSDPSYISLIFTMTLCMTMSGDFELIGVLLPQIKFTIDYIESVYKQREPPKCTCFVSATVSQAPQSLSLILLQQSVGFCIDTSKQKMNHCFCTIQTFAQALL